MSDSAQQTRPKTKEDIYDEQISPLMHQIITICQKHEIPMVMSFHIPNDLDDDLSCTTGILNNDWGTPQSFYGALKLLKDGYLAFATAARADGGQTVHVMPPDQD